MSLAIFIPAIKKNVAFADDLVKKLDGVTLVQRAIDKAKEITFCQNIYVITDSEEICLISKRNNINHCYKKDLQLTTANKIENLSFFLSQFVDQFPEMVLLSPYAPMLRKKDILGALEKFRSHKGYQFLVSVRKEASRVFKGNRRGVREVSTGDLEQNLLIESQALNILSSSLVKNNFDLKNIEPVVYKLDQDLLEIRSYQDWWVCEKLLRRKRVVFRVIGDEKIGMGHIYRSLTLAHEITDHEVHFACDEKSQHAVKKIAGNDYLLGVYKEGDIADRILDLKPDLVINDMLNTKSSYILKLRKKGIGVINFEDLGSGASHANLTINELYEKPALPRNNILYGQKYFFLREEFNGAKPHRFRKKVSTLLVTFGASDPSDFTRKILRNILEYCEGKKIKIFLVTGGGYSNIKELKKEIAHLPESRVQYVHTTGIMSHIMEQTQIAIAANGRTAYELGHMNIPSIILSHHEREEKHSFATKDRGFIPLGLYNGIKTDKKILKALKKLVEDTSFRKDCFDRLKPFRFHKNKGRVLKLISEVLKN
jgi:spore coat polysaccharide biosynthesis predicted glycosyltransferase SpsG/CMP-N-acetylneuraminic acid synthetase